MPMSAYPFDVAWMFPSLQNQVRVHTFATATGMAPYGWRSVVVVSADRSSDKDRLMRQLGAVDYLIKPFDVRDLLGAVDSALGGLDSPQIA